jgi:hypothetical protein
MAKAVGDEKAVLMSVAAVLKGVTKNRSPEARVPALTVMLRPSNARGVTLEKELTWPSDKRVIVPELVLLKLSS